MLKLCVKASPADQVRHRVIPTEAIVKMAQRLDELKSEVQEVLKEEKEEKAVRFVSLIFSVPSRRGDFFPYMLLIGFGLGS